MHLIILGPPGSGKGTIADQLEQKLRYAHISAGAILREEVAKDTTIGREIQKYIDKGKLVPNALVNDIVRLEVQSKKKYVLDGFPRTLEQAKAIADMHIDKVILLDIDEKTVIQRFAGRRVCSKAGHGYHLQFLPPKKKSVCDIDGSKLIRRKDDQPKVIRDRFRIYHRETLPVVRYFQRKKMLQRVDADGQPGEVFRSVKAVLKK